MTTQGETAKPSWQTRAVTALLQASGGRKLLGDPALVHAALEKRDRKVEEVRPPAFLNKAATATREDLGGWPVYRITPTTGPTDVTVVFLHGGGFFREIVRPHWSFVRDLAAAVPAECVVPIYPLVPHGHAAEMVATTAAILARTIEQRGSGKTVVMGNSAGGGLALAATQVLLEQGGPQPDRVVLISPWLDVTMTDPTLPALERDDPFHQIPGLLEIGRLYAGDLDPRDPRVSPLRGHIEGLPPLTVFCGTREMTVADTRTLARRAAAAGTPIDYHEGPALPHNYALMPSPEGRAARKVIVDACRAPHHVSAADPKPSPHNAGR
ncbi:MAG: alpha/beta hydrolase [Nocardia sp.]|uniref:alpha/beta fold hydrolase n=1 Tax=Nocardia sp. TaxID=1821 RepID=UPI00261F656F|nr:alpha/beta hydrolase [Nocardia sp.]MCU1640547.1 alpha/beta hydrolase [Nocardia sp.]